MVSSQKIIAAIEKEFPVQKFSIKNLSDLNFEAQVKYIYQFILGVTTTDRFRGGIGIYEDNMKMALKGIAENINCFAWPFNDEEIQEAKIVLEELGRHFEVNLDIERMFKNLHIKRNEDSTFYIVITVVEIPILFAE